MDDRGNLSVDVRTEIVLARTEGVGEQPRKRSLAERGLPVSTPAIRRPEAASGP